MNMEKWSDRSMVNRVSIIGLSVILVALIVFCSANCHQFESVCEEGKVIEIGKCSNDTFFHRGACRVKLDTGVRMWTGNVVMLGDVVRRCYYKGSNRKGLGVIQ